jgi:hypothetical protein
MSVYDEYAKQLEEDARLQKESVDVSTKAQLDALAENKKLIEAEKQNAMRGAYVDYAKNINPYGVQSELAYASGLGGAGKGETAHANYYGSYQRRLGDINTAATEQLRGIAQQEASARLAGDQAKLGIDSQLNQQKADAQREDRTNAYNQLLAAIGNTGYTPTDAELQYAGMTRDMANSYRSAYQQSLYSKSASAKPTYMTSEDYAAAEEYVAEAAKEYDGLSKASDYLAIIVNRGDANFTAAEAQALLARYFPKDLEAEDGSWYMLNDGSYMKRKPEIVQNGKTFVWDNTKKKYTLKQEE